MSPGRTVGELRLRGIVGSVWKRTARNERGCVQAWSEWGAKRSNPQIPSDEDLRMMIYEYIEGHTRGNGLCLLGLFLTFPVKPCRCWKEPTVEPTRGPPATSSPALRAPAAANRARSLLSHIPSTAKSFA